jgi:hypothetical protein
MPEPEITKLAQRFLQETAGMEKIRHYTSAAHCYREFCAMYPGNISGEYHKNRQ